MLAACWRAPSREGLYKGGERAWLYFSAASTRTCPTPVPFCCGRQMPGSALRRVGLVFLLSSSMVCIVYDTSMRRLSHLSPTCVLAFLRRKINRSTITSCWRGPRAASKTNRRCSQLSSRKCLLCFIWSVYRWRVLSSSFNTMMPTPHAWFYTCISTVLASDDPWANSKNVGLWAHLPFGTMRVEGDEAHRSYGNTRKMKNVV